MFNLMSNVVANMILFMSESCCPVMIELAPCPSSQCWADGWGMVLIDRTMLDPYKSSKSQTNHTKLYQKISQ